jgi:ribonuclease HI
LETHISIDIPWDFFDGAAQGTPSLGGDEGIIFLSEDKSISFSARLNQATNNYIELMALKLTLLLEKEKGISHLNICGDSLLTI